MKPTKTTSSAVLQDQVIKGNELSLVIEETINSFASSAYEFKTRIERFTEIFWYCKPASKFYERGSSLFEVSVHRSNREETKSSDGYFLDVLFFKDKDFPQLEKVIDFIELMARETGLPVICESYTDTFWSSNVYGRRYSK